MTRTLLFDLDGTLVDSRTDLANSVRAMQAEYGSALSSEDEVAGFIGDGVGKLVERSLPGFSDERRRRATEFLMNHYREHAVDHTRPYPGVEASLRLLAGRGHRMAVVTNKPQRVSRLILDRLGLSGYFPVLVGGDTLPEKKPHPAPLRHALELIGAEPAAPVPAMIGDSHVDVQAGRAAGLYTVGILSNIGDQTALKAAGPDRLVKTFADIIGALS